MAMARTVGILTLLWTTAAWAQVTSPEGTWGVVMGVVELRGDGTGWIGMPGSEDEREALAWRRDGTNVSVTTSAGLCVYSVAAEGRCLVAQLPGGPPEYAVAYVRMSPEVHAVFTDPATFAAARAANAKLGCISNVRQLAMAVLTYAEDFDETLPAEDWAKTVAPYVRNDAIFRCPGDGELPSYAMNPALFGKKLSDIREPSETVMLFESDNGKDIAYRHGGVAVVAYADGHAAYVMAEQARDALRWESALPSRVTLCSMVQATEAEPAADITGEWLAVWSTMELRGDGTGVINAAAEGDQPFATWSVTDGARVTMRADEEEYPFELKADGGCLVPAPDCDDAEMGFVRLSAEEAALVKPVCAAAMQMNVRHERCMSNVRILVVAACGYSEDHGGVLPSEGWREELGPYLNDAAVLACGEAQGASSYALNPALYGAKLADIADTARTVLVFETDDGKTPAFRHHGGSNVGFADGHVKWLKPEQLAGDDVLWDLGP